MTEPISIPGKVIVFDYGEVISTEQSAADRAEIVALAEAEDCRERFWDLYWLHRFALDQGAIDPSEYWRRIERDLGVRWERGRSHELWLHDFRSWLTLDAGMLELLLDLQRGNTRMAMLSNAGRDFGSYYRHGLLGDFFEVVIVSGEVGHLKPSLEIYERLLLDLDAPPEDVIFIDNRADNVVGAEAFGITAVTFTGAADVRRFLAQFASLEPT